ncbi:hypothetical protein K1W54_04565 [Micromonospora sp. CPCC 205371]|nr:hypothetical protein [Micromonospora sp. CPCC 205371]
MTYPLGPRGQPDRARATVNAIPDPAVMRIGRVTRYNAGYITVAISDSDVLVDAAYIFGAYQPVLGDIVAVVKQGNQWLALGAMSPNPDDNPIANYSFEDGEASQPAPNWTIYHDPSSTNTTSIETSFTFLSPPIDGQKTLRVTLSPPPVGAISSSFDYVSSDPFPVTPGELWSAQAWVLANSLSGGPWVRGTGAIFFSFYNNAANTYPNTAAPDGGYGVVQLPTTPPWLLVRSESGAGTGVEVPAGVTHARVTLETDLTQEDTTSNYGITAYWDRVIATKLS